MMFRDLQSVGLVIGVASVDHFEGARPQLKTVVGVVSVLVVLLAAAIRRRKFHHVLHEPSVEVVYASLQKLQLIVGHGAEHHFPAFESAFVHLAVLFALGRVEQVGRRQKTMH